MNDLVRARATDPETGKIKLGWEFAAGAMAGGSQVVCSDLLCPSIKFNILLPGLYKSSRKSVGRHCFQHQLMRNFLPLTVVKIRLQMQGEAAKVKGSDAVKRGAVHIVKQLGLLGLYKGSTAWSVKKFFCYISS